MPVEINLVRKMYIYKTTGHNQKNLSTALLVASNPCEFNYLCLLSRPRALVGYRRSCERSYKVSFGEKVDHLLLYSFYVNDVILLGLSNFLLL